MINHEVDLRTVCLVQSDHGSIPHGTVGLHHGDLSEWDKGHAPLCGPGLCTCLWVTWLPSAGCSLCPSGYPRCLLRIWRRLCSSLWSRRMGELGRVGVGLEPIVVSSVSMEPRISRLQILQCWVSACCGRLWRSPELLRQGVSLTRRCAYIRKDRSIGDNGSP